MPISLLSNWNSISENVKSYVTLWLSPLGLEWCFNSPPKPHGFVSLQLQSCIHCQGILNLAFHRMSELTTPQTIECVKYLAQALVNVTYSAARGTVNTLGAFDITINDILTESVPLLTDVPITSYIGFMINIYHDYLESINKDLTLKMLHSFFITNTTVLAHYTPGLGITAESLSYFASSWSNCLQPNDARLVQLLSDMVANHKLS